MFELGARMYFLTTMTTGLEFYVYRFLLGLCEGFFISCNLFITHSKLVLAKGTSEAAISLMLTSLLFSNIIGGHWRYFIGYNVLWTHGWAYTLLSLKLFYCR